MKTPDQWLKVFTEREQKLIEANDLQMARIMAIKRLREEGYSLRDIGAMLDLSHEWVRQLSCQESS